MLELDHLLLGCANLEEGIQEIYQRSGVQAVPGGPHPGLGTHNALLSLMGPSNNQQYLEIIAPDPLQKVLPGSMASQLVKLPDPTLIAWAAKSREILRTAKQAESLDLAPKGPSRATRRSPTGEFLAWQLLFVGGSEQGMPFFIDWLETSHPSISAPAGCVLKSFEVFSPAAEELATEFKALDLSAHPNNASKVMLKAVIESPKGPFELVSSSTLMSFV